MYSYLHCQGRRLLRQNFSREPGFHVRLVSRIPSQPTPTNHLLSVHSFQLAAVNSGKYNEQCTDLAVGSVLCLGTAGEDCKDTYTVKEGDTCDGVTSASGMNSTILYLNNPQINKDCTNIYIGEVSRRAYMHIRVRRPNYLHPIGPLCCQNCSGPSCTPEGRCGSSHWSTRHKGP